MRDTYLFIITYTATQFTGLHRNFQSWPHSSTVSLPCTLSAPPIIWRPVQKCKTAKAKLAKVRQLTLRHLNMARFISWLTDWPIWKLIHHRRNKASWSSLDAKNGPRRAVMSFRGVRVVFVGSCFQPRRHQVFPSLYTLACARNISRHSDHS